MSSILITGGASGLGKELVRKLAIDGHSVITYDIGDGNDVRRPDIKRKNIEKLDVLINCAGVNRIDWIENFTEAEWDLVMDTNAKGMFRMTQACLPMLIESKGTVVNIVSNASHMPMTCSTAYNASKAAAEIMTRQMARELKRHQITVFGISPNKLAGTGMSKDIEEQVIRTRGWTAEYARQYQLNALLAGEETPPELVAHFIAYLLRSKEHHRFLTGCIMPYGA